MTSPKRLARIAGVLYLLVGIFGGFAQGFVEPKMYVAGNAAATVGNVVANSGQIAAMHFFSPSAGWILTGEKLLMTRDGGAHWRDVTPGPREPQDPKAVQADPFSTVSVPARQS